MRTSKTVGGVKHNYYYVQGKLMYEDCPSYKLFYTYDANGFLSSIKRVKSNGVTETFGVHCNIFGDVIAIYFDDGFLAATYTYDSWGKLLAVTDMTGNDVMGDNDIWTQNSIRYRGYVYDEETQLYYLQSRYYDPETCRFINADDYSVLTASPTALSDKNLFAYCDCNPIIRADDEGDVWHIVAGGVIGGVASFAATLLTGGSIEEAGISFLFGAASGALTAAFPGAGLLIDLGASVAEEMTINAINKKTLHESTTNVVVSAGVDTVSSLTNSGSRLTKETMQEFADAIPRTLKGNHPSVKSAAQRVVRKTSKTLVRETGESTVQKTIGNFFKNIFKAIF